MARTLYGKKKTTRNILIGVLAVLLIAAAIFLAVTLKKDSAGMNWFQRIATAASADGERVSFREYRVNFDTSTSSYQSTTLSDDQIRMLQENAARQSLIQKIYIKEAKALGLTLTDEQIASCKTSADEQLASLESYYAQSLISSGSYSKAVLDKQINSYYQSIGMSKSAYRAFLIQSMEADLYRQVLAAYYQENGSGIGDDELEAYYRNRVEELMTTTDAEGNTIPAYSDGDFWNYLMWYWYGYSSMPMCYIPEGFIYIDLITLQAGTREEIMQIVTEVTNGDRSFDELLNSDENKDTVKTILNGPYPIAEKDHSGLFSEDEIYTDAAELGIGQIGVHIEEPVTADDGTTTVTAYLFRRAEGNICYDGDRGVIKMDYFTGLKDSMIDEFRVDRWFSDIKFEDSIYTYRGALQ